MPALPIEAENGGVYLIEGREFVHLDGQLYLIQFASREAPWLVDRRAEGDRWLPALPLQRIGPERWAPAMPVLRHDPGAHGAAAGRDGFIRIGGKRFIALSGITVEVSPPFIHNEVAIRHLAHQREEALPDIDLEHVIRAADGTTLLHGRFGYYTICGDGDHQRMWVGRNPESSRYALAFDLRTEEWHVLDQDLTGSPAADTLETPERESSSDNQQGSDPQRTRKDSLLVMSRHLRRKHLLPERPALRLILADAFDAMASMRLHRGNRRSTVPRDAASPPPGPVWIGEMRNAVYAHLPNAAEWARMTVLQMQRRSARAVDRAYRAGMRSRAQASAYCHEMADLLVAQMHTLSPVLQGHMLQFGMSDLPGTGLTHVAVLYAEDRGYFRVFGPLDEPGPAREDLAVLGKAVFADYLWQYREVLILLDPWGETKVLELDRFPSKDALTAALDETLRLAGFAAGPHRDFRGQAVMPPHR